MAHFDYSGFQASDSTATVLGASFSTTASQFC